MADALRIVCFHAWSYLGVPLVEALVRRVPDTMLLVAPATDREEPKLVQAARRSRKPADRALVKQLAAATPKALAAQKQAARKQRLPLTTAQLTFPTPPLEQNAGPDWVKLTHTFTQKPLERRIEEYAGRVGGARPLTEEETAALRQVLEEMREVAAALYHNEFGNSWKPVSSSRFNHGAMLTSALVEGRDFLRARAEAKRRAAMPDGTPVIFAGGRTRHATDEEALTFTNNIWATLDKVRDRVPDMVLVHGGDSKGADRLASSWAERREVPQVTFSLDMRLGARAGFKRNERMLSLDPRYVVAFPGNGVLERLVIEAKARRITVVDRRGPLGTSPKAPANGSE